MCDKQFAINGQLISSLVPAQKLGPDLMKMDVAQLGSIVHPRVAKNIASCIEKHGTGFLPKHLTYPKKLGGLELGLATVALLEQNNVCIGGTPVQ